MTQLLILCIALASLIAAGLVPLVRHFSRQIGIVDKPDKERKLHDDAVALGGGLAVYLTVALAFALVLILDRTMGTGLLGTLHGRWYTLFAAAAVLMGVGLIDDAITLRGRQKLLMQILVVVSVVGGGTLVEQIGIMGTTIHLGIFAYPLTVLWLLAAINALNLIDGADGMAATVGSIISCGLALLCMMNGNALGAVVAAALAGSLIGFLFYNRPPATIYLGDAGSMVIGLFIGVISIWSSVKGSTLISVAPLMVLTIPLFDSVIALLRRVLTGRSIYATDRGHLHHRLLDRFSHPLMLVVVATLCGITTIGAILAVYFSQQWIAIAGVFVVTGALVFTRSFGNAELRMLVTRTSHFGESMLVRASRTDTHVQRKAVQLQGNRCWEAMWDSLVELAGNRGLDMIKLDVGVAWMQEGYHGSWRRTRLPEKADQANIRIPIYLGDRQVARLEAIGDGRRADIGDTFQMLLERSRDLADEIHVLLVENDLLQASGVAEASEERSETARLREARPAKASGSVAVS